MITETSGVSVVRGESDAKRGREIMELPIALTEMDQITILISAEQGLQPRRV
jgi:hypothetical protein